MARKRVPGKMTPRRAQLVVLTRQLEGLSREEDQLTRLLNLAAGTDRYGWGVLHDMGVEEPDKLSEEQKKAKYKEAADDQEEVVKQLRVVSVALSRRLNVDPQESLPKWQQSVSKALIDQPDDGKKAVSIRSSDDEEFDDASSSGLTA